MSDVLVNSLAPAVISERRTFDDEVRWKVSRTRTWEASAVDADVAAFDTQRVSSEDVEGLPLSLVEAYAELASRHATVREVEPGVFFATVAGLEGAWGDGGNPVAALKELGVAIVGWVAVKRRVGATDIPPMEGLDINPAR